MWEPEQRNSFIAIVVGIYQKYHVGFTNLSRQVVSFLREGRGIDDSCGGDIFGGSYGGRDGNLRKNRLNLIWDEDTFDQRRDEAGLAGALVAADADSDWYLVSGSNMSY